MKHKSIYALQQEQNELARWFEKNWAGIARVSNVAVSLLSNDTFGLAKAAGDDLATARADVEGMRKALPNVPDDDLKSLAYGYRMSSLMREYQKRSAAIEADIHRSRRFNDLLVAQPPGATILSFMEARDRLH
jgi:hypothetical protein